MDCISKARLNLENLELPYLMVAFDMVGAEYLENEAVFINSVDGFYELCDDFNLGNNEILSFILGNKEYNIDDKFIIFNGHDLWSINNSRYVYDCVYKHMNNDVAEYVLSNVIV